MSQIITINVLVLVAASVSGSALTLASVTDVKSIHWHKQIITHNHWTAGADPERAHQSPCQPCSGLGFILDNLAPTASLSPLAVYGLRLQRNRRNKQVQWQQRWEETRSLEKTGLGIFFIAVFYCNLTQEIPNKPWRNTIRLPPLFVPIV